MKEIHVLRITCVCLLAAFVLAFRQVPPDLEARRALKEELDLTSQQVQYLRNNLLTLSNEEIRARFPNTDTGRTQRSMAFLVRYLAKKELEELRN